MPIFGAYNQNQDSVKLTFDETFEANTTLATRTTGFGDHVLVEATNVITLG